MIRQLLRLLPTCLSCGADWGQPHTSDCKFTHHRGAA